MEDNKGDDISFTPVKEKEEIDFEPIPDEKKKSSPSLETSKGSGSDLPLKLASPTSKSTDSSSDGFRQGNYDVSHLSPLTPENINDQPEFVAERKKHELEALKKPEMIKKTDQKMSEINSQVVDVSRQLNSVRKAQSQNIQTLTNLKNQIDDINTPQDQKDIMIGQYNSALEDAKTTQNTEKQIKDRAVGLQKAKSTLNKIYDVQSTLEMNKGDDALKATGNFLTHVYNAIPETIAGVGSLIESYGDIDFTTNAVQNVFKEKLGEEKGTQLANQLHIGEENKFSDILGNAIQEMGHDLKSETDEKYDDKHYITSTAGDIVGSVIVAATPTGVIGDAGKVGQMITGATTATMQMADQVHEEAKNAGLSDSDAGIMTLSVAPISGLLEVWGANNIIDNVAGRKVIKELVNKSVKDLAGKEITKDLIFQTVGDNFKTIGKKYGLSALKSAGEEGATEGLQGEVQAAAENIYDEASGEEAYGTKFFSKETQANVAKQAAIGAVAGSAFGILTGISTPKNVYDKAIELKNDPEKLSKFNSYIDTEVEAGHLDKEKAADIKSTINSIIAADDRIPASIKDTDKRFEAIDLIKEKSALEEEIRGKDNVLATPQKEKIKAIDAKLEAIATGRTPVEMKRKDFPKKEIPVKKEETVVEEKEKPIVEEKKEKVEEVELKPLSEKESKELVDLEKDKEILGLSDVETERYNELKSRNNDQGNISGVHGNQREREAAEQKKPVERSSKEETPGGGVLQTSAEEQVQSEKEITDKSSEGIPYQKVVESKDFNKAQKRVARSVTNVVNALSKIAPDLKVVLHENEQSFENAAYEANKKIGLSDEQAKNNVSGRAFYFGKNDHSIHVNLSKAKSNTLFHEGVHPILNAVEENSPGTVKSMFRDLQKIEKKMKLDGRYTENFASQYGDMKHMEAVTEFIADVADGNVKVTEGNLVKMKRFFGRMLRAMGIEVGDMDAESIVSLSKKIKSGFEKGETLDIGTNRSLKDAMGTLNFQLPENTDNIDEEDIKWALRAYKKFENYQQFQEKMSTTERGRELLNKNIFGAMLQYNSSRPQASMQDRIKAVSDRLHKAKELSPELKEKIEEHSLRSEVFSHKEAKEIADIAIDALGVDGAVELAERRLKGSVKAFIYGAAVDHYANLVNKSSTQEEKEAYAQKGADIAEQFQKDAEDYGRFISAIGEYYKNSPLIIKKTEVNKLKAQAKEAMEKAKSAAKKIRGAKKEFDSAAGELEKPKSGTPRKKLGDSAARKTKRAELLARWKELRGGVQKQVEGFSKEQSEIMVQLGLIHVGEGAWGFKSWAKRMKNDLGISDAVIQDVWNKEKIPADLDEKERTIEQFVAEDLSKGDDIKRKQEATLNKYFPKKVTDKPTERLQEHEKIIEQYNAGVFDGGTNADNQSFKELFYEKLGIVNPNDPEIQAKIGEFAEKIAKAPEGSIMQRETQEDMLNYLANIAYQARMRRYGDKISSIWYANILSSPATHLRNVQYNIITSAVSQPFLMLEKAIINKDWRMIGKIHQALGRGFSKGLTESNRVIRTGRSSRFDKVSAMNDLERGNLASRLYTAPGRALKASDILFTDASYNLKLEEIARQFVKHHNPGIEPKALDAKVNELLGNTEERKKSAQEQAKKEMSDFYGPEWENKKGAKTIYKIRTFELMEKSIPQDIKDDAVRFSKKGLLTSRPSGVLGVIADKINGLNQQLYFTKFVMPFVNVPFNLVNAMIERSPIGFLKAWRRAEGFGKFKEELTDDEVQELYLKAINYTLTMAALALANGDDDDSPLVITGNQTGDYMDNKGIVRGGGLEPYSVYILGKKVMSYKTSPWAAAFLIPGYIRDAKLYGDQKNATDIGTNAFMSWVLFINDQSAMQGVQGLLSTVADAKKTNAGTVNTTVAKYLQNIIMPYSGAEKFVNNTVKAMVGSNDRRAIDPIEYFYKDIPGLDLMNRTRMDHFGQPVKEQFDIPLVPLGARSWMKEMSDVSKYYELCKEKNFFPTFSTQKKLFVDGVEENMSKKDLDDLNTDRGQLVAQALDGKNVFVPEDGAEGKYSEMTTMEYLKTLEKDDFAKRMKDLFEEATKYARIHKFGAKVGVTPKDIEKAQEESVEGSEVPETGKETVNKELLENYDTEGHFTIAIDNY